ncbi:MAG: endonuclease III [Patescibacteria group bacterium]|jgi:endonuclease-3
MTAQRIVSIIEELTRYYDTTIALHYTNTWELLVAVMLSAQCTDKRVNMVTPNLFNHLSKKAKVDPPAGEAGSLKEGEEIKMAAEMPLRDLEKMIRSTGFYHMKALHIQQSAQIILEKFAGKVPATMEKLISLPGVARKTANVIMSEAFNKIEGVTVDTHVKRISQRLRFVNVPDNLDYVRNASPEKIEQELMANVPQKYWKILPHALIMLGRDVCRAQNPQCEACIIRTKCPVARIIK